MKANNVFWFGYLETANGKTLVVRNVLVDAEDKKSLFLYNAQRDALVEYKREIIEPKLVTANEGEIDADELEKAYKRALRKKRPNTYNLLYRSSRVSGARASASNDEEDTLEEEVEIDGGDDDMMDDFDDNED